jgi:hypothetical protein
LVANYKSGAQISHLQPVAADVYGAEQGEVAGHLDFFIGL